MLEIIYFIPNWNIGGAEKVISELIDNTPKNIQTSILTFKFDNNLVYKNCTKILKRRRFRIYYDFLKYIFDKRPDVIHAHMNPVIPFLVFLRIFNRKIKLVYTVHGEYHKPRLFIFRLLHYIFYTKCNIRIVCVCDSTYNSIKDCWNIPRLVVFNGISPSKQTAINITSEINLYKKTDFTKIFLTITRIVPVKNLELMITAFEQLSNKYDFILIIIGYDPTPNRIELQKLQKMASDRIFFLGPKYNGFDYLFFADAFCMSSNSEAFPMTILEAFSASVPVLATNVGGIPEAVIHGFNGFLSEDLTVSSYKKIISDFISLSPQEIFCLKQNALKSYKNFFTSKRMYLEYSKIYQNET